MAHHLLGSYQRAFLAILLAQFTRKRFTGGMCGVVRLATSSITVQVTDCFLPTIHVLHTAPYCVLLYCRTLLLVVALGKVEVCRGVAALC